MVIRPSQQTQRLLDFKDYFNHRAPLKKHKKVNDMTGTSVTTSINGKVFGASGNLGHSTANGNITSNSIGISGGKGFAYGITDGTSKTYEIASFNPKEWVRKAVNIK